MGVPVNVYKLCQSAKVNECVFTACVYTLPCYRLTIIIITIIYSLTARVVGAPQMISQLVFSLSPRSPLPSGTWRTPGLSILWCRLPPSSSAFSSSPFHCALQDGFGQTLWTGDMSIQLQFASFSTLRRSSCGPIACWIFGTDFLVGNIVFVWDA